MKNLRLITKYFYLLLFVILTNGVTYSQEKKINTFILNGSDTCEITILNDSTLYDYMSFLITEQVHKTTNGHTLKVLNKKDNRFYKIGIEHGVYFLGLIGDYMLIDIGTSNIRTLNIYHILTKDIVFQNRYFDNIEINNSNLIFLDKVDIQDETLKPNCPQNLLDIGYGIGYSEKLVYHIRDLKLKRTGIYKCHYFE